MLYHTKYARLIFTYICCRQGWQCSSEIPTNDEVCTWSGVLCQNNQIVSLSLANMGISGTLSPWIGTLYSLRHLNLWGNNLRGTLPIELGGLKSLQTLTLFGNSFIGKIPDRVCNQAFLTGFYPCFPSYDAPYEELCGGLTAVPDCISQNRLQTLNTSWYGGLKQSY